MYILRGIRLSLRGMMSQSAVTQLVDFRLGIEGLLVQDSSPVESLCCTLEQDTLSIA